MNKTLTTYADELGLNYDDLDPAERDRITIIHFAKPQQKRPDAVRFVRCGNNQELIFTMLKVTTNTKKRELSEQQSAKLRELMRRRVRTQLGLERAALLPEHIRQLDLIADLIPDSFTTCRPLNHVNGEALEAIRQVVALIPQTSQAQAFLRDTEGGVQTKHDI